MQLGPKGGVALRGIPSLQCQKISEIGLPPKNLRRASNAEHFSALCCNPLHNVVQYDNDFVSKNARINTRDF